MKHRRNFGHWYTSAGLPVVMAFSAMMLWPHVVEAGDYRDRSPTSERRFYYGDQKGCYWFRGRRYCSRYCYWDVDGHRYCQERKRLAVPMGDPYFEPYPPEPPIYVRKRQFRP